MEERRRPPPETPVGYIDRLPARGLLNRLPVPIWAVHDGAVLYTNRAFEEMLGLPAESLIGAAAVDVIADESARERRRACCCASGPVSYWICVTPKVGS